MGQPPNLYVWIKTNIKTQKQEENECP